MPKEALYGKTLVEIRAICEEYYLPKYTATQITDWLYKKHCSTIDEMSNLSKRFREKFNEHFEIGRVKYTHLQKSKDGTKKYLFPVNDKRSIESVYIPELDRATICVSSQVGCKMGCKFCATGKQGFQGNLTCNEILNQIGSLPEREELSNIVFMGMGEPFDNMDEVMKSLDILTADWGFSMSPKRITVSTIGIIPEIKRFLDESKCHLAISLHSPFEAERKKIMPIENKYSLKDIIKTLRQYDFFHQQKLSFEYILLKGINDSPQHSKALSQLVKGLDCLVNLIRYHSVPDEKFEGSDEKIVRVFKDQLTAKGVNTTVRSSRGEDIMAACGLLSTKEII